MPLEVTPPKRDLPRSSGRGANLRGLWRLSGWGAGAALALAALAFTVQTEAGGERLQLAFAPPPEPPRAIAEMPPRPSESELKARALEAQLRVLAADRDRLAERVATLEHHVDDMTGSIARQAAQPAPPAEPAPAPAPVASAPPEAAPQVASVAPSPEAPVSTTAAAAPPAAPIIDPLAMPAVGATDAYWPEPAPPEPGSPAPEITESIPLPPPPTVAAVSGERLPPQPGVSKHEYGIELATAPDIETLRARWAEVKANYGPLLADLQPVAVHDRPAGGSKYRLIAGPLTNFTAAKQKCARFTAEGGSCRPARFDPSRIVQR